MDKTFNINAADINLDGEVNDLDYVELERKLNGLSE